MAEKFDMGYNPRGNLRNWLENNFSYFQSCRNVQALEEIAAHKEEIFYAVFDVLLWTQMRSGPQIKEYYKNDLPDITIAYHMNDMRKFAENIRTLRDAINVE